MKNNSLLLPIFTLSLAILTGCSIRAKIDSLKDQGERGIPKLEKIATTHKSAFIRITAIYALGEIESIKAVNALINCYSERERFLKDNPDFIIADYNKKADMYSIDLKAIDYAMREACFDGINKHYLTQDGFFYSYSKKRVRPKYKAINKQDKDIVLEFLFTVLKDNNLPLLYESGKGIRYRAAYLLQKLNIRYAIPETYNLLKTATDTATKQELLELILAYGEIQYFPLTQEEKTDLLAIKEEYNKNLDENPSPY